MDFTGERVIPGKTPLRIYNDHIARYRFAMNYVKNKRVLDIACGVGYGAKCLLNGGAQDVIGVDISKEAVNYAKTHYGTTNLTFLQGDATKLPFPSNYFDVIVSFETIEHVTNYREYLLEISRILCEGGTYIVSTPNRIVTSPFKSLHHKPNNIHHVVEFTSFEFETLLKEHFFTDINLYGQRMIYKSLLNRFIRIFISAIKSQIYFTSGSSKVKKLSKTSYTPRYIIAICKK